MQRLLLVNPPTEVYAKSRIKAGVTFVPQCSLALLGAVAERDGHDIRILDLCISADPIGEFDEAIRSFRPTVLGLTVMTPHYPGACGLVRRGKELCPELLSVAGGAHASILPKETVGEGGFDVAVVSEGEGPLAEILARPKDLASVAGIAYRDANGEVKLNPPGSLIQDLDALPLPAWHLFDISRYRASRLTSRRRPVGSINTSRGCPHHCIYCSKEMFGTKVRFKSIERILQEIQHAWTAGFRELHVWDDHFATKAARTKEVCRAIADQGLGMALNLFGGLRADSVDLELFQLLKQAGVYQTAIGAETGNEELLKRIRKGIAIEETRRAFALAREAGIETLGFFIIGLPGETPETCEQTIRFAVELDPDYAKVTFCTPLPGTELMRWLEGEGRIKTHDWSKYAFHNVREVYDHPTMSWDELEYYYKRFYDKFYLRPSYILRRIGRGILTGQIIFDAWYAAKTWLSGGG